MAVKNQILTDEYALYNGDCLEVMPKFGDGSMHFSIYSPPFAGLYHYSSNARDLSNSRNYKEFFEHYEFVVREIHRVTMPGRLTAVHCMDFPTGNTGCDHYIDFPGDIIRLHEKVGFKWACPRIHIWKEPLEVRNRTLTKALAHKTIVEDSSHCTVAGADYLLVFRAAGKNPVPIKHPSGLDYYAGGREVPAELHRYKGWKGKQTENRYSHWIWRQYASCCWGDIRLQNVLPFREAKESDDEKHVHPLQLDVIARAVTLWSNPGEKVLTPFLGVGSEAYGAVIDGRLGIGVELKEAYYLQAEKNLQLAASVNRDPQQRMTFQDEEFADEMMDEPELAPAAAS